MDTKIPKFRRCVIQNFPFIEQDFDALTNYGLDSKIVQYLNTVITSQNNIISRMQALETYINSIDFDKLAEDAILNLIREGEISINLTYDSDNQALTLDLGEN